VKSAKGFWEMGQDPLIAIQNTKNTEVPTIPLRQEPQSSTAPHQMEKEKEIRSSNPVLRTTSSKIGLTTSQAQGASASAPLLETSTTARTTISVSLAPASALLLNLPTARKRFFAATTPLKCKHITRILVLTRTIDNLIALDLGARIPRTMHYPRLQKRYPSYTQHHQLIWSEKSL
jgi:hypothetical protein